MPKKLGIGSGLYGKSVLYLVHGLSQNRARAQIGSIYFWSCNLDHPNALRKMVSTIIINYIESKVGIFNNFVVLSNRVLKSNVEKKS